MTSSVRAGFIGTIGSSQLAGSPALVNMPRVHVHLGTDRNSLLPTPMALPPHPVLPPPTALPPHPFQVGPKRKACAGCPRGSSLPQVPRQKFCHRDPERTQQTPRLHSFALLEAEKETPAKEKLGEEEQYHNCIHSVIRAFILG